MTDITLALMTGVDIPLVECQLVLHQPTLREIGMIGEKNFFIGIQCLCIDKNSLIATGIDLNTIANINNFNLLIELFNQDCEKKNIVLNVLTILFPCYKVVITPRSFCFTKEEGEIIVVDEQNFEYLQHILKQVICLSTSGNDSFNPDKNNLKAQEIAAKLNKARQRVAEIKAKEGKSGTSSLSQYISIITVGINSMSLQDTINLTIFQMYDLVERYGLYINWDLDIRSRLAGGKPDNKADNWMKSIH